MTRQFWKRNLAHLIGWFVVVVGVTTLGVANALPGKNTVDSGDIINGQVKKADIAAGAVNGAKVANGSLTGADIGNGEVKTADIAKGAVTGAKVANGSLTGADIANGSIGAADLAPALRQPYFARIGWDGTDAVLVEGRGVASVDYDGWAYNVTFVDPVDTCAWTASVNPFFAGPPNGWGEILVGLTWDNTVVPTWNQTPDPDVLRVLPTDSTGAVLSSVGFGSPEEAHLQTFSVVVNC